jgi:hypothetical protein
MLFLPSLRANVIIIVVRYTYGMEKGSRGLTVGFRTAAAANPKRVAVSTPPEIDDRAGSANGGGVAYPVERAPTQ